jgi:hypothetical protein
MDDHNHWYSSFFDSDRFVVPKVGEKVSPDPNKYVWIVRSEKVILGYLGPFQTPEEADRTCTVLKRDPNSRLERVRLRDLR